MLKGAAHWSWIEWNERRRRIIGRYRLFHVRWQRGARENCSHAGRTKVTAHLLHVHSVFLLLGNVLDDRHRNEIRHRFSNIFRIIRHLFQHTHRAKAQKWDQCLQRVQCELWEHRRYTQGWTIRTGDTIWTDVGTLNNVRFQVFSW